MKEDTKIFSIGQFELASNGAHQEPVYDDLPVIALRDFVLFPGVTFPISLGRERSVATAAEASERGIPVGVFSQRNSADEDPDVAGLYEYGVLADVMKILELPDGQKTAILVARGKLRLTGEGEGKTIRGALSIKAAPARDTRPRKTDKEFMVMTSEIRSITLNILRQEQDKMADLVFNIENVDDPVQLVNVVATHVAFPVDDKMAMLAKSHMKQRAMLLLSQLAQSEQMAELRAEIMRKTKTSLDENQKRMVMQHQFDVLREELFGDDDDCAAFLAKAETMNAPAEVKERINKEVEKLRRLHQQSPDYSVQYQYLQTLVDLPWSVEEDMNEDFSKAEDVLNADHYGLEKVKDRVLEQIAVMMNNPHGRSPIICLVGAPGVGKTSLGQSVARAMGRPYQRVSLGGLHDEAEIRGHRRTYVGAMPGRIIDAIRRAKASNPVLLLDEIDKTANDYKGDPSSALLEVLDPEQNSHFHDNYVDLDYDLSHVLFIATANTLSTIPQPLIDRMEIIEISGYLLEEKVEIALRHLIPRVAVENGFNPDEITFSREALVKIIEGYTSESGVRQLEKVIAKVIRRIVLAKMRGADYSLTVEPAQLRDYLGVERYTPERYENNDTPGVAVGLAWTQVGGEILFIESSFSEGKGEGITLTGNLGDVMKESAMIALQVARTRASRFGIEPEWFERHRLHLHVPEGAIPKDGPSAGITMYTSILSALTGRRVRAHLAMTGEITLRGKVLPVGGIKEKILAAKRAGITDIILCEQNRKDIEEIRPIYLEGVTFHFVATVDDVTSIALGL